MIAFEIVVTLVGALITAFFAVSQIQSNALRRQKLEHGLEMLDLAQKLKCDENNFKRLIAERFEPLCDESKHPVSSGARFLTQELFDIIVFIGFGWWAFYLFQQGSIGWGIIAAIFALVGLMMAFVTWSAKRQRNAALERLRHNIDHYVATPAEPAQKPETQAERQTAPEQVKPAPAPVIDKAETVSKAETAPVAARVEAAPKAEAKPAVKDVTEPAIVRPLTAKTIKRESIPEDSILKRHFLATLRYEIESCMPPRPTDSVLKRHHDQLLETKLQIQLAQLAKKPEIQTGHSVTVAQSQPATAKAEISAQTAGKPIVKDVTELKIVQPSTVKINKSEKVPEDSILKRHFLAMLRYEIESCMAPRPTDSILKRHHDHLLESKLQIRLSQMDI